MTVLETHHEQHDPYIGLEILGQFRIESKIGQGGMGAVYLADQPSMSRKVAVKILQAEVANNPELAERFGREARALANLDHPNIVKVFNYQQLEDGSLALVMEYVRGQSLKQLLETTPRLEWTRAVEITRQAAEALEEAHSAGILHRDIKPGNIFLVPGRRKEDQVKVLDFGIAKVLDEMGAQFGGEMGVMHGTPMYMSPEQARGEKICSRSDIYSLGICLYMMLTGRLPYTSETLVGYIMAHQHAEPAPLGDYASDYPARLETILKTMLAKQPADRHESMHQVAEELAELLKEKTTPATTTGEHPAPDLETNDPVRAEAPSEEMAPAVVEAPATAEAPAESDAPSGMDTPQEPETPAESETAPPIEITDESKEPVEIEVPPETEGIAPTITGENEPIPSLHEDDNLEPAPDTDQSPTPHDDDQDGPQSETEPIEPATTEPAGQDPEPTEPIITEGASRERETTPEPAQEPDPVSLAPSEKTPDPAPKETAKKADPKVTKRRKRNRGLLLVMWTTITLVSIPAILGLVAIFRMGPKLRDTLPPAIEQEGLQQEGALESEKPAPDRVLEQSHTPPPPWLKGVPFSMEQSYFVGSGTGATKSIAEENSLLNAHTEMLHGLIRNARTMEAARFVKQVLDGAPTPPTDRWEPTSADGDGDWPIESRTEDTYWERIGPDPDQTTLFRYKTLLAVKDTRMLEARNQLLTITTAPNGAKLIPLYPLLAPLYGQSTGVLVIAAHRESTGQTREPPSDGQLRAGDLILELNGQPIDQASQVVELITRSQRRKQSTLSAQVKRIQDGEARIKAVTVPL